MEQDDWRVEGNARSTCSVGSTTYQIRLFDKMAAYCISILDQLDDPIRHLRIGIAGFVSPVSTDNDVVT